MSAVVLVETAAVPPAAGRHRGSCCTSRTRAAAPIASLACGTKWPRLTVATALFSCGLAVIAYNARVFWTDVVLRRPGPAVAPMLGGLLAAAGVASLPSPGLWMWSWLPLLLDWGGLPQLARAPLGRVRGKHGRPG